MKGDTAIARVARHDTIVERMRQEAKWGEQNHEWPMWLTILTEELGEASKEYLKWLGACADCGFEFNNPDGGCDTCIPLKVTESGSTAESFRAELVQVAAVALAALECHDRHYGGVS